MKKNQLSLPGNKSIFLYKLFLIMKLTIFLLLISLVSIAATGYSQTEYVTVKLRDASLKEFFSTIEQQTSYKFLYRDDVVENILVNLDEVDKPLDNILNQILDGSRLTYKILANNLIAIAPRELLQQQKITGTVTDKNGAPIPGANVVVTGTTMGSMTDIDGKYSIEVPQGSKSLTFSFIGMESQVISIGTLTQINVTMAESAISLEEVVVIGYGVVKKSDITGSVSSFSKEDMNKGVSSSLTGLLQGKAAGVQIIQASAEPGGGVTVQIRGAGSINASSGPLYVIDGLPIETDQVISGVGAGITETRTPRNPLSNINPSDIESIEILKDASATAIYGARGANGVILVTTKKGISGAMKINYNGYKGIQIPEKMVEVLNAEDYQRILNQILETPGSNVSELERVTEIQNGGTNWQNQLLRNAAVQSHSLSINGGNNDTKYFASLNYFNQDGILLKSDFQRYDSRFNLEHKSNKLLVGINFSTSYSHDDNTTVGYGSNESGDVLYAARNYDPTLSVFDANGNYNRSYLINVNNPLALLNGETSKADNYRILGTVFGEYTILKGWTAKVNIGFDTRNSRRDDYVSRLPIDGISYGGIATILTGARNNYLGEFTSTYTRDFSNNSSITALGGITYQKFSSINFSGSGSGFPVDESFTNNMGTANPALNTMASSKQNNKLLSYLGRVNFNLFNKFLFTASLRADGSSRFGENNKYGFFPSGAFAWKMNEYQFIQDLNVFSTLKLRASIGRTGNQDILNYLSLTTFGPASTTDFRNILILDGKQIVVLQPLRLANPDLKWETSQQIDIGLEMGFLHNRILASVDYYEKNTFDMLFDLPLPASTGYASMTRNIGDVKNNGFEFTIDSRNLEGKFKWNTSLNLSTLKNRVTNMGNIPQIVHTQAGWSKEVAIIRVGETLNSFYGYKTDGIWQNQEEITASGIKDPVKPGNIRFVDMNGDGVVNTLDRVILGNSFPSVTMGLTNVFSYKNFELNVFVNAMTGVSMLNEAMAENYFPVSHRRNRIAEPYLNRWTPENPSTKYPSFVNPGSQGLKDVNDLTVEDASYIRLQSVRLSYQVPLKNNKVFDKINFYISLQNLYTWTRYPGQDPTTNSNGDSSLKIDFNSYPVAKTFISGIELGF